MQDATILQTAKTMSQAVAPVFLITGVAAMLSTMTVRYNRVIDRTRELLRETLRDGIENIAPESEAELKILYRRAKLLRTTVIIAILSVFAVSATVCLLFANMMFHMRFPLAPEFFFIGALLLLLVALILFIEDFALSLKTIKLEMRKVLRRDITNGKELVRLSQDQ